VVAVSAYNVQAVKWEHGWELHVQDVGVTQCRTLATAAQQVRDFVATMGDTDDAEVHLSVAIGGVEKDVERARRMTAEAIEKQHQAATESRRVARELRHAGLSVADTAAVMDISKGRVSQLISS
jgi:DNA-directed RNA polymerase specialized sigma24 family protein